MDGFYLRPVNIEAMTMKLLNSSSNSHSSYLWIMGLDGTSTSLYR
jgi:hypothetical protein